MSKRCEHTKLELGTDRRFRHGVNRSPAHRSWESAKARCLNPQNNRFYLYGARGITMCAEWRDDFTAFLRDMGPRPARMQLDRIDNDGNYEPGNCRWATCTEQCRNQRRNVRVTVGQETLTVIEWSQRTGLPDKAIYKRLVRGWSHERAVTEPLHGY